MPVPVRPLGRRATLLAAGALCALLVSLGAEARKRTPADAFPGWFAGIDGYEQATAEQERSDKPLLVYFHAPWCPYCKRFNAEVLASPDVATALGSVLAVQIDGDSGGKERRLMARFGTEVFPSLYLRATGDDEFRRVDVFDGNGHLCSPAEFAAALSGDATPR